jgi:zinc transport system substrate-binding protein
VAANFYPIYEAAVRVGGDRARVSDLTPPGVEPHDLELSSKQIDQILDADVVVYLGRGFQPAVEAAVKQRHGALNVDLLAGLASQLRSGASGEALRGGADPHVWLDPTLMARVVIEIRDAFDKADPSGAGAYRQQSSAYLAELDGLDRQFRTGLKTCARRIIVTAHAAFGYLAARYGLVQEAIAGLSPEAEPNPKHLAELADLVRRDGVTTIFTEELVSPRVADALAREAGVRTAVLNPLEGLTAQELDRGQNYITVMGANLKVLRAALGCE